MSYSTFSVAVHCVHKLVAGLTLSHSFTWGNLRLFNSPTSMSLDGGKEQEYPERTHSNTGRKAKAGALTTLPL